MMTAAEITAFLASVRLETHCARYMHAVIYRAHTGRWPTWIARAMRQRGNTIVEVAELRSVRARKRYTVITWRLDEISMRMQPCNTLAEALRAITARTFRIDHVRAQVRG